jgi:hypothetical protein
MEDSRFVPKQTIRDLGYNNTGEFNKNHHQGDHAGLSYGASATLYIF